MFRSRYNPERIQPPSPHGEIGFTPSLALKDLVLKPLMPERVARRIDSLTGFEVVSPIIKPLGNEKLGRPTGEAIRQRIPDAWQKGAHIPIESITLHQTEPNPETNIITAVSWLLQLGPNGDVLGRIIEGEGVIRPNRAPLDLAVALRAGDEQYPMTIEEIEENLRYANGTLMALKKHGSAYVSAPRVNDQVKFRQP